MEAYRRAQVQGATGHHSLPPQPFKTTGNTAAFNSNIENSFPQLQISFPQQNKRNAVKNGEVASKKGRTALGDISNVHKTATHQEAEACQRSKADRHSLLDEAHIGTKVSGLTFKRFNCDAEPQLRTALDVLDIDANTTDPILTCPDYAAAIFSHLRESEYELLPPAQYMNLAHNVLTPSMRAVLVDWLVEVVEEFKLCTDTLFMAVQLIDRYLSQQHVARENLQLIGVACMWISAKYEEIYPPTVREFAFITDSTYTVQQIIEAEATVLASLSFRLTAPSIKAFLRRFLQAAQPDERMHFMASYFSELSLLEYDFVGQAPSVVAASSVLLARIVLGHQPAWTATLQFYTGYMPSQLQSCIKLLADGHIRLTTEQALHAVHDKYSMERFACVARLAPVHALQVMLSSHNLGGHTLSHPLA